MRTLSVVDNGHVDQADGDSGGVRVNEMVVVCMEMIAGVLPVGDRVICATATLSEVVVFSLLLGEVMLDARWKA